MFAFLSFLLSDALVFYCQYVPLFLWAHWTYQSFSVWTPFQRGYLRGCYGLGVIGLQFRGLMGLCIALTSFLLYSKKASFLYHSQSSPLPERFQGSLCGWEFILLPCKSLLIWEAKPLSMASICGLTSLFILASKHTF